MTQHRLFAPSLLVSALLLGAGLAGCSSAPPQNSALSESRALYNAAQTNPQVSRLAPLELDLAGKTLVRADAALARGDSDVTVGQLAYLVKQQVGIAEATARRKAAEAAVAGAAAERDRSRLDARTAEVDAARRQVEMGKLEASRQAAELNLAAERTQRDEAQIASQKAEAETARLRAIAAQQAAQIAASSQAAALAAAEAQSESDRIRIDAGKVEADAARRQIELGQAEASRQASELSLANARAERNQAQIARQKSDAEAASLQALADQQAAQATARTQANALAAATTQSGLDQARIAQQAEQLKDMNAKQTARGQVITLGNVFFSVNQATLSADGQRNLRKLADYLNEYPERKVLVEGHTDSTGSNSLNQALSERRADAVRTALMAMNVAGDRVPILGLASAYPAATNDTAAGRQLNRRVEIIISDGKGMIPSR